MQPKKKKSRKRSKKGVFLSEEKKKKRSGLKQFRSVALKEMAHLVLSNEMQNPLQSGTLLALLEMPPYLVLNTLIFETH